MKIKIIPFVLFTFIAGTRATAESLPVAPTNAVLITSEFIERLMDEAQTNNPGFLAASSRASSATANAGSVRTWDDPTFLFGGSVFSPQGFDAAQQGDLTYGITQKLPLWGNQYSGDGEFRSGTFTLSFSVPWFNESKYSKDYQREKDAQSAAEHDRDDQVLMVREELHHLTLDIENQRREALLYRDEISTRAGQMLASRLADWEAGRGTLRDVLDARRMWLDSQLTAAKATAGEQQDVAELLLWTGLENTEALTPLINEPPILHHHENN